MTTETHEADALTKSGDAFHSALVRGAGYEAALRAGVLAALAQHESEHRALLADNAALLNAGDMLITDPRYSDPSEEEAIAIAVLEQPHPGAALLSEMDAMRKRVAELEDKVTAVNVQAAKDRDRAENAERERDEARARLKDVEDELSACQALYTQCLHERGETRAAVLEEVLSIVRVNLEWAGPSPTGDAIRALATTPLPTVVPVAKVREVFVRMYAARRWSDSTYDTGRRDALLGVAHDLGINLDGES